MRLVPYDKKNIKGVYKSTKNYEILNEFIDCGLECAKLEGWGHSTAYACARSFNVSIKRFRMAGILAIARHGEVYLIKENT